MIVKRNPEWITTSN